MGADDDGGADVKVATHANGRCGTFADSLPVLISSTGVRPGEVAGDVTVCAANMGSKRGPLSLRVLELVDLDPACSGEEVDRDPTCGESKRGELSPALRQEVGLGSCSTVPGAIDPALDRRLPVLQLIPLTLVQRLRPGQVVCVRLRLRYDPLREAGAVVSQSDRSTWRYGFSLKSG